MTSFAGSLKALLLASALAIGIADTAAAADLLLPPPPPLEPMAPPVFGGWYLRGDVGVGITQLGKISSTFDAGFVAPDVRFDSATLGDSAFVGLGVGYQFNNWLRADITGEYRTGAHFSAIESYAPPTCPVVGGRCYDNYSGQVSSAVVLANGYVDLGTWYGITPFVGAGVGVANSTVSGLTDTGVTVGGFGFAPTHTSTNLAWAATAGLDYAITPNLKLEISYRYLDMGDVRSGAISCTNTPVCGHEVQKFHLASHDIRIGMRWMFASIPLMAPELPLVTKY